MQKLYKERNQNINQKREEKVRTSKENMEKRRVEEERRREELINQMLFYGLYQYPETVDNALQGIKYKQERKKALKTQIQFRKIILQQSANPDLFILMQRVHLLMTLRHPPILRTMGCI